MNTRSSKAKGIVFILVTILMVTFGTQSISYAQEGNPTITASVEEPLTEATLSGSVVTLTLSGSVYTQSEYTISHALTVSGIEGVTFEWWKVERVSDAEITFELTFSGNMDTDRNLVFTVGARAIAGYAGDALTTQIPVTAGEESLDAATTAPLTEGILHGSIITLTLSGRRFADRWDIRHAVSISGIDGVTVGSRYNDVYRVNNTEAIILLRFSGNIDIDATLTLTVGAEAIVGGYDKDFTFEFPVTAVEESLTASTAAPLTEATLHGRIITLTLTGRKFNEEAYIGRALSVSGIEGVTVDRYNMSRVNDTETIVPLRFSGNIDADATLTLTVGADAIGYNKDFTFQFPVTAVEESLEVSTEVPLTEAMLSGGVITLTLTGRQFVDDSSEIKDAVSVSGIDGVSVAEYGAIRRVSDTVATVELTFSGNIDEDATLTLTVGPDAIRYDKDFTFQFPVTAVEESLKASTEFPLTEVTLNGSIVTLTLNGRRFADGFHEPWTMEDTVSVSGIDGVTLSRTSWDVKRVSDTEIAVLLEFDGTDFDTDATLTFTVGAGIANYNQDLTAQVPVTAIQNSNATVSISPSPAISPNIGERLTLNLNIAGGENIAGYQATVLFDDSALEYIESANGDYLPADTFFLANRYYGRGYRVVRLTANTLAEAANGDGTLATLTFEIDDFKPSTLTLSKVYLVDTDGKRWEATTQSGEVTIPPEPENAILGDINRDGVVNIQDLVIVSTRFGQKGENIADINGDHLVDIVDLVLVASAVNAAAAAPALNPQALALLTTRDVQGWLSQAQQLTLTDPVHLRGIAILKQFLKALTPKQTLLLPNYPNPFNPETWIPYYLSNGVDVHISIYNTKGVLVRRLDLGHQMAGYYTDRTKAAYWDGRNAFGERVASGVYIYHLSAGDYSATRKMLILK